MNSVLISVIVMLVLALMRVHVVLSLFIGALVGGLLGGLGFDGTMLAFQDGLSGGAKIALSYALLGAFAMAVASSGLPEALAQWLIGKIKNETHADSTQAREQHAHALNRATLFAKWGMIAGILAMAIMSQNLIPVHIAFIPLLIPPLLPVFNQLRIDRRLIACVITFGLVTTYMFLPVGFGAIFLNGILLKNINAAGLNTDGVNVMHAMGIPAIGMIVGLLIAVFFTYRKPRDYAQNATGANSPAASSTVSPQHDDATSSNARNLASPVSRYRIVVALVAIVATFAIQLIMMSAGFKSDSLLVGALVGLSVFMVTGAVKWNEADDVFTQGMKMMAMIGFIMISAQGFAAVMNATGDVTSLVETASALFSGNKAAAAFAMLLVGLIVTMGIGSSFSTLPIITTIYVPLCLSLGFSPLATVSIIGTAGALGDAGSPASDSTLGPTSGLNIDGQHDHIRDSVIPTFLHYNIPLLIAGWIGAMVL
ncbi:putative histidine transporter YuiF (NhaC family) [Arcanobacterium pluranimalium]|uniref:Na+/H+ antiporter family protein n=1 Tax=Arcanobacterium pluranimalium TaxID=108028 RepID=UPI00195755DF|nr:Na+/H+ antiporter family protein [Arcanobacterium pluranimalium]MBM7824749.1 putative histidine transporter YuiF (NhaC family) [Arcanobacterium pluranimalium]